MSSTIRASGSFFASFSTTTTTSFEVSQSTVSRSREDACSSFAARRMRDSFECGSPVQQRPSITQGGCIPSCETPASQAQGKQDLAMLSSALNLVGSLLNMVSGFLGGSKTGDACADGSSASPASPDNCGASPASPDNCGASPASPDNCGASPASPDDCGSSSASPEPDNCHGSPSPSPSSSPSCQPGGKTWDVFFDAKQGTKTKQKSPIVVDLNGNGRPDITGSNIKGNGKLEGKTVKGFDLDPTQRQWENKSVQRRPGHGAPALPKGATMQVYDSSGKLVAERPATEATGKGKHGKSNNMGLAPGQHAEFRDQDGKLIGELKPDGKKGQMMYFWGNKNENEWTKPWDANGGDGILAMDLDGDGKITSSKELFGEWDVDGQKKFSNGYEKLAKYFDKDGNGVVEGDELKGLKVWEDKNGDGITQDGELVDASAAGIKSLNVKFDPNDMSASFNKA